MSFRFQFIDTRILPVNILYFLELNPVRPESCQINARQFEMTQFGTGQRFGAIFYDLLVFRYYA